MSKPGSEIAKLLEGYAAQFRNTGRDANLEALLAELQIRLRGKMAELKYRQSTREEPVKYRSKRRAPLLSEKRWLPSVSLVSLTEPVMVYPFGEVLELEVETFSVLASTYGGDVTAEALLEGGAELLLAVLDDPDVRVLNKRLAEVVKLLARRGFRLDGSTTGQQVGLGFLLSQYQTWGEFGNHTSVNIWKSVFLKRRSESQLTLEITLAEALARLPDESKDRVNITMNDLLLAGIRRGWWPEL